MTTPRDRSSPRVPTAHALFALALRPIQVFLRLEAASGLVLLGCAVIALAWANADHATYAAVFDTPVTVGLGATAAHFTVLELVNDGLMTLFFFVVGMEIKRELVHGELRAPSQAALPAIAALGGMLVPGAIFLAFNAGGPGAGGWGIPMATDIAFCIGVLTLLKRRVPHALIVFVTALAVFDDIGGIVVIALFYGTGLHAGWLAAAAVVAGASLLMSRAHVASAAAWAVAGVLLWFTLHHSGVHATVAGVILGLAVPASPRRSAREVLDELASHSRALADAYDTGTGDAALHGIEQRLEELEAPLTRFVHALHPWVAFGVMPLFALANSGVQLSGLGPEQLSGDVAVGTLVALFVGKQVGIFAFTAAAVRAGLAGIPGGATHAKLLGVSIVAGIGFTVALFIAGLAYPSAPALLDQAKLGILAGSLTSGLVGALVLRMTKPASAAGPLSSDAAPQVPDTARA